MSEKVNNWVTDPFGWLSELFVKRLWLEGGNFDVSPHQDGTPTPLVCICTDLAQPISL